MAGVLALSVVVALALVGVVPDNGGHAWHAIESALNSAVSGVTTNNGGHAWH